MSSINGFGLFNNAYLSGLIGVDGQAKFDGSIIPYEDSKDDLGSATNKFNNIYGNILVGDVVEADANVNTLTFSIPNPDIQFRRTGVNTLNLWGPTGGNANFIISGDMSASAGAFSYIVGPDITNSTINSSTNIVCADKISNSSHSYVLDLPASAPGNGTALKYQGGVLVWSDQVGATGDVLGPPGSTNNCFVVFDGTDGKKIKQAGNITFSPTNQITGVNSLTSDSIFGNTGTFANLIGANVTNSSINSNTNFVTANSIANATHTYVLGLPSSVPSDPSNLRYQGGSLIWDTTRGDVFGPTGSISMTIPRFSGTSGKILQTSSAGIDNAGNMSVSGYVSGTNALFNKLILLNDSTIEMNTLDTPLKIVPNGTGGLQMRPVGDPLGNYAIDMQLTKTTGSQVASGTNSLLIGGSNNTAAATRSAVIAGNLNTINSSANDSIILCGSDNTISSAYSIAGGQYVTISNERVFAWNSSNLGSVASSQTGQFILNVGDSAYTPPNARGYFFNGGSVYANSGIFLPTVGGTGSILDYYEEGTHNTTWGGIYSVPQTANVKFTRIGNQVTLRIPQFNAVSNSAGTSINATTALPTRLRPPGNTAFVIQIRSNTYAVGHIVIQTTGDMSIYPSINITNTFTNGAQCGLFNDVCVTYNI